MDRSRGSPSTSAPTQTSKPSNALEQKLDRLQKEIEELRGELLRQGHNGKGNAQERLSLAEAEVESLRERFVWSERMLKKGYLSEREVQAAGARLKEAESALEAARKELVRFKTDLKTTPWNNAKPEKQ
jgi:hypothetical protein